MNLSQMGGFFLRLLMGNDNFRETVNIFCTFWPFL